jgi:hypothetical protein
MPMTCWEGEADAAFTPGSLSEVQAGASSQITWAQAGQYDPVTGLPLVRHGSSGPALIVGDFTGVESRCAAAVVTVHVGGPDEALVVWLQPVIQDPSDHNDHQKPSIWSQLLDANNQPLPCSGFQVNSAARDRWAPVGGQPDVYHRPYFPNLIPLRGYEGQQLRLQLATMDCTRRKHYGYSAMQVYHVALTIDVQEDPCAGGFTLTAPPGAWAYRWTCDTGGGPWDGESITTSISGTYTVTMQTPSGCEYQMSVEIPAVKELPTVGPVKVGGKLNCAVPGVELTAPDMENVAGYTWSLAGTNEVLGTGPTFMARKKGTYILTMPSMLGEGCGVTREAVVDADMNLPTPLFTASATDICQGDSVHFAVVTPASAAPVKVDDTWDLGDGTTGTKPSSRVYGQPGAIVVERAFTRGTCEERYSLTVNVHPLPRPGLRVLTHCGPARGQRTYEFVPTGIAPSPSSLEVKLTTHDGQPYPQQRNGSNILVTIPGDTTVRYHVEVTDALGCYGAHDTTWTAPFDPVADFRWQRIPPPGAYHLAITDSSRHYTKQAWQVDGATITSDSLGRAVLFDYATPGEYLFTLEVTGGDHTCPDRLTGSEVIRMPHFEQLFGNTFQWPAPFERLTPIR